MLLKILFLFIGINLALGSKMEMQSFATVGNNVKIECILDHDQYEIQHVQWYKDNRLFYKFIPGEEPTVTTFDLPDVPVNVKETKMDVIILNSVIQESSGVYTCELKSLRGLVRMSGTLTVDAEKD